MNRSPGGSFALVLVYPLNRIETVLARFTTVGLDVCRKQDFINDVGPRAADSGGLAFGTRGDITTTSQSDCKRRQPPKHDYKSQAQPNIAKPHAHFPSNRCRHDYVRELTC